MRLEADGQFRESKSVQIGCFGRGAAAQIIHATACFYASGDFETAMQFFNKPLTSFVSGEAECQPKALHRQAN